MDRSFEDSYRVWGDTWDDVLRIWKNLKVQEGWRPEITPAAILIAPPRNKARNLAVEIISRALVNAADESLAVRQSQDIPHGIAVPSASGIFTPDLCVVQNQNVPESEPIDSAQVVAAVEITFYGTEQETLDRRISAYAQGGIAQLLLVDAFDPEGPAVFVFSWPEDGVYRKMVRMALGEKISLSDPVPAVIDTSLFPDLSFPGPVPGLIAVLRGR